ncbi:MAG: NAD-glutamate dehydrogenase [Gemmatimonas sp.]
MDAPAARDKSEVLAAAARMVADAARRAGLDAATAQRFVDVFWARVDPGAVTVRGPDELAALPLSLLAFAEQSRDGVVVRVLDPKRDRDGWQSPHTVVQIVNDDMPFLVDSLAAFLQGRRSTVHLLVHPIVHAARDAQGRLVRLGDRDDREARPESWMHIEIDRLASAEEAEAVREGILKVLADVRAATSDWRAMRDRMVAIADASAAPTAVDGGRAEDLAFLGWAADDHFTFLGFREYAFARDGDRVTSRALPDSGLGVLRDPAAPIFHEEVDGTELPPDVRALLAGPGLLMISKANRRATVHRPVHMDTIGIKRLDAAGRVVGEYRFVGLFTSTAYTTNPRDIPLLSRKIARVVARADLDPASHDGKALATILETYPRDELFQISENDLLRNALGILSLGERQRIALFMRRDPFERFVSCLVFVPRDRYSRDLRVKFEAILGEALHGTISARYMDLGDVPFARVHIIVKTTPGRVPSVDEAVLEAALNRAARTFEDDLRDRLVAAHGEAEGLVRLHRFAGAFPTAYRERFDAEAAVADIARIDRAHEGLVVHLYRPHVSDPRVRLKLYRSGDPLALSDIVPILERFGVRVLDEHPFEIRESGNTAAPATWIHDLGLEPVCPLDDGRFAAVEEAIRAVWDGRAESDGFNRLMVSAALAWRDVVIVRAYARYLRQIQTSFSVAYLEEVLVAHPRFARLLCRLFEARFDPHGTGNRDEAGIETEILTEIDTVKSLDEDRILRRFLNVVKATVRTNVFQRSPDGSEKGYVALKIASGKVDDLPLPKPMAEIFVYSPRVEAIHLRGGKVARGGIRWSDRREDFRTEILGLMKAQTAKNAVIVPVGAKGGFVVKRPPPSDAGRDALQAEAVECYRTMMRGLLDLTDNRDGDTVTPPDRVVRHDDDDPYLVVAADKGTATFSDIANGIARDYGYWLDDAFASGGSAGYDHKAMGITARGAWESVKRHFRELGRDIQAEDFTAVGVGDMSGDVFGNGMLQSRRTRLIAAFDHRHIFVDPNPDPARSYDERKRLFDLPRSSWADYDGKLLSKGGAIYERGAKSCALSAEARAALGIEEESLTPPDLVRAILKAPVDLLWLGGIGTFVKASTESHADAGDRANDSTRIDARELGCKVVGEGANLGFTQRGRIEYARAGGRLNTDSIDNSAGVDTSDHEVNIKIALGGPMARGELTRDDRDRLLAEMTDEVAALVLRDNYLQTQAISVAEAAAPALLDSHRRLIATLSRSGRLDRRLERLPGDDDLAALADARQGLTRPEIAVLLAYSKLWLNDEILESDLPDDPFVAGDLARYFPTALQRRFKDAIAAHRLRREIIATSAANSVVNRVGPSFVIDLAAATGAEPSAIVRAYLAARDAFALRDIWEAVEALDNRVPAATQTAMIQETIALLRHVVPRLVSTVAAPIRIGPATEALRPAVAALATAVPDALGHDAREGYDAGLARLVDRQVPNDLAARIAALPHLGHAVDVGRVAAKARRSIDATAAVYFALGGALGFEWLRDAGRRLAPKTEWERRALSALADDIDMLQADATSAVLGSVGGEIGAAERAVTRWLAGLGGKAERTRGTLADIRASTAPNLAMLTVAVQSLRQLIPA